MKQSHANAINDFLQLQALAADMRTAGVELTATLQHTHVAVEGPALFGVVDSCSLRFPDIHTASTFLKGLWTGVRSKEVEASEPVNAEEGPAPGEAPGEAPRASEEFIVKTYALEANSPVAEAVSSLLAAVVDPSATKGDRLRAAGEVLNAVNSL